MPLVCCCLCAFLAVLTRVSHRFLCSPVVSLTLFLSPFHVVPSPSLASIHTVVAHHFLASGARNSVHIFTVVGCMDDQLFQELLQASNPPISASESEEVDEDFEWPDEEEEVKKRTDKEDLLPTTTRRIYKTLAQEMEAEKKRRPANARLQLFCSSDNTLSSRHVYDFDLTTHLARHNFHSIFFDHSLAPSSSRSSLVEQYADICREVAPLARLVLVGGLSLFTSCCFITRGCFSPWRFFCFLTIVVLFMCPFGSTCS